MSWFRKPPPQLDLILLGCCHEKPDAVRAFVGLSQGPLIAALDGFYWEFNGGVLDRLEVDRFGAYIDHSRVCS